MASTVSANEGISSQKLGSGWEGSTGNVKASNLNSKDPAAGKGKPSTGSKKAVY